MIFIQELVYFLIAMSVQTTTKSFVETASIQLPGDIIFGGLFTLHVRTNLQFEDGTLCKGTFSGRAFQEMASMLMAVEEINLKSNILPGIRIGVNIMDTCGSVDFAVKQSLNFSFVKKHVKFTPTVCGPRQKRKDGLQKLRDGHKLKSPTVALIGPDISEIARAIADLAGLFHIPVVSHSATSEVLGDRIRFRHFFRTVPPDTYQTKVIVSLLTQFKWNYVILLTSDDEYGRSGRNALRAEIRASSFSICTFLDEVVNLDNLRATVSAIGRQSIAKVVILFSNLDYSIRVIEESQRQNLTGFTWIASDTWTGVRLITRHHEKMLHGMLGIRPAPAHIPRFREELVRLLLNATSESSVWLKEFKQYELGNCQSKNLRQCIMDANYDITPYLGSMFDAVRAVAYALHAYLKCSNESCKGSLENIDQSVLLQYFQNLTFLGVSGRQVTFDWFGSGSSSYQIMNLKQTALGYNFTAVASWHYQASKGRSNFSGIFKWISDVTWNSNHNKVPTSSCSRDCQPGKYRSPKRVDPKCCWDCTNCGGNTITNRTNRNTCTKCSMYHYANIQNTACLPVRTLYMRWSDPVIKVILSLAMIGLTMVTSAFAVFFKFRETPIVRAASRGLCFLLLFGVSLFYLLPFSLIGEPTQMMCNVFPFTLGLCISLNVGTMLIKTNRIARIFSKRTFRKKAKFLGNRWQYLMIICIVVMEESISVIWVFALDRPHVETHFAGQEERFLTCSHGTSFKGMAVWCFYNAGLVLVCTYQAFLVRKVPHNYNEAKFLAFTMVSICITILVYVPVNVGAVSYSRDIICCFLYVFVATVEFTCIFVPKLYIILLRPSKNLSMEIQSTSPSIERRTRNLDFDESGFNSLETRSSKLPSIENCRKWNDLYDLNRNKQMFPGRNSRGRKFRRKIKKKLTFCTEERYDLKDRNSNASTKKELYDESKNVVLCYIKTGEEGNKNWEQEEICKTNHSCDSLMIEDHHRTTNICHSFAAKNISLKLGHSHGTNDKGNTMRLRKLSI